MIFIMDNDKKLFNALQWAIEDMDMKQTDVGSVLGLKQPAVSLLLSGKRKTRLIHIKKMATHMGISSEDLLKRSKSWEFSVNEGLSDMSMDISVVADQTDITTERHRQVIGKFQQKDKALKINELLLALEQLSPKALEEAETVLGLLKIKFEQEAAKKRAGNGNE